MKVCASILLTIVSIVNAVTNEDFIELQEKLVDYIAEDPDRHIPLLVRNSFHDLFLQKTAGLRGCIIRPAFFNDQENAGLEKTNKDIQKIVKDNFPNAEFSFGDVIAFAGKVAVETAYPCVKIDFKFNRDSCNTASPVTARQAPSAFIDTIAKLQPMLNYLGGTITAEDMAILFAGAHGIKGARCGPSGWFGVFATVTSGKAFIEKTFSSVWKGIRERTLFQFFTGDRFDPETSIIRLPTDMIFFPSKIPAESPKDDTPEAAAIEAKLKGFLSQDRSVFDNEFARAYSKLLAISGGNTVFTGKSAGACASPPPVSSRTSVVSTMSSTTKKVVTSPSPSTSTTSPSTSTKVVTSPSTSVITSASVSTSASAASSSTDSQVVTSSQISSASSVAPYGSTTSSSANEAGVDSGASSGAALGLSIWIAYLFI